MLKALLEGSPDIGMTSLVRALATRISITVDRINPSNQTDISDLFCSDLPLPVEGGALGQFQALPGRHVVVYGAVAPSWGFWRLPTIK